MKNISFFIKQKKVIIILIILINIMLIFLHITPQVAIRTWLFSHGHIQGAFSSSKIEFNKRETQRALNDNDINNNEEIYYIKNSNIKDWLTGNPIFSVKVKKHTFLYFCGYYYNEG